MNINKKLEELQKITPKDKEQDKPRRIRELIQDMELGTNKRTDGHNENPNKLIYDIEAVAAQLESSGITTSLGTASTLVANDIPVIITELPDGSLNIKPVRQSDSIREVKNLVSNTGRCPACGKQFIKKRKDQKYDTDRCRYRDLKRKERERKKSQIES